MKRIDIDTWEAFRAFLEEPPDPGTTFYWRGQGNPDWPLASSLERKILGLRGGALDPATYASLVQRHLESFKAAACGMRGASPKDLSEEQWWALGRHYGLETPLLDWTEKPYIALFFALRGGDGNEPDPEAPGERFAMYRLCHSEKLAGKDLAVVRTPIDELGRMQQQRGLFTWIKAKKRYDLLSVLEESGRGDLLTQARVSSSLIPRALHDLELHGIDHRLLFPDMYGAARYANGLLSGDPIFCRKEK